MIRREVAIHLRMGEAYMEEVGGNKGEKKKEKKKTKQNKRTASYSRLGCTGLVLKKLTSKQVM